MLCLIFGVLSNSCNYSYEITDEFVFINETDHTIEFYIWANVENGVPVWKLPTAVKILPNSKSKVFFTVSVPGPKKMNNPNLPQGLLLMVLQRGYDGDRVSSILVDGIECFLFENSGFALASNYKSELLGDRHARHTYTFTNADFEIRKPCEEEDFVEED